MDPNEQFIKLARQMQQCVEAFLRSEGIGRAARGVVWARYYGGNADPWESLKSAIGALEDIVGRPDTEEDI